VNAAVKVAVRLFVLQIAQGKASAGPPLPVVPRPCGALEYQRQRCGDQNSEAHHRDCDEIKSALFEHFSILRLTNAGRHEQTLDFRDYSDSRQSSPSPPAVPQLWGRCQA
jgi:hypothetical protein